MTESLGSLYLYVHLDPCLCEHNSIIKISSSCAVLALSYQQLSHCMEKKKEYPSTPSHCEAGRLQIRCKNQSLSVLQFWISYTYFHRLSAHIQKIFSICLSDFNFEMLFRSSGNCVHKVSPEDVNLAAEWKRSCCFSVVERLCTALVILQKSTRLEETAIADKADQVLFCFQGYKCTPCPETWLQYGENCYYFSKEWKTWQESKARCSALESRFLKIESKKELVKILFCCSFLFLSTCTTSNVVWTVTPSFYWNSMLWHARAGPSCKKLGPCLFEVTLLVLWLYSLLRIFTDFRRVHWDTPAWVYI